MSRRNPMLLSLCLGLAIAGCDDDSGRSDMSLDLAANSGGDLGTPGSAQACTGTFKADNHCDATGDMGATTQATNPASCHPNSDMGAGPVMYGDTVCGTLSKDDDCKYTVSWSSTPIYQNTPVDFTITLGPNVTGNQVTGAKPRLEAYLSVTHPAASSGSVGVEMSGGVYKFSGVRFDAPGMWTVRFHVFEDCSDLLADSQHGHAAFFVNVP